MVHLFPHWNWKNASSPALVNGTIDLWAFSSGESVELFVNNRSLGRQPSNNFSHAEWPAVKYEPGFIEAMAYDANGNKVAQHYIETTGEPTALRVSIKDNVGATGLHAGCGDVALVQVEVVDAQGRIVPTANDVVTFSIQAANDNVLDYIGGGNGNPSEHTPDKSLSRPAFGGLVLGIFQENGGTGSVKVVATSPGLKSDSIALDIHSDHSEGDWLCPKYTAL